MKILNFGSLNIDIVYEVEHLVRPGETISSRSRQIFAGGKGLNQSIALARAGAEVAHAGAVGAEDGKFLTDTLQSNGVDVRWVKILDGEPSGHAIIMVDEAAQNSIILHGGTNQWIDEELIEAPLSHYGEGDLLVLQNEVSNLPSIIEKAHARGMRIILNPSPLDATIRKLNFEKLSYVILNEIEAADITGETQTAAILQRFRSLYPDLKVVLTLGSAGAVYQDTAQQLTQPAHRVKAVDTTAAGDTFTGYFIAAISQDRPVQEALQLAAKAAAISVTRKGAEASIPWLNEVEDGTQPMGNGYKRNHQKKLDK